MSNMHQDYIKRRRASYLPCNTCGEASMSEMVMLKGPPKFFCKRHAPYVDWKVKEGYGVWKHKTIDIGDVSEIKIDVPARRAYYAD